MTNPSGSSTSSIGSSGVTGGYSMRESHGLGWNNEIPLIHEVLLRSGYRHITDDAQYGKDVVACRERHSHVDGTQVHVDMSPNDNSPGKRGAWVFHTPDRAIPGFGASQLKNTIALHHRRMAGL